MRARSSVIEFPSGARLRTPRLIPSFSSRGLPFKSGKSTIGEALLVAGPWAYDAILISAYDVHYEHLPAVDGLLEAPPGEPYGFPEVLFVDSGGYEADEVRELPDVRLAAIERREWSEELLRATVDAKLASELPVVLVNLDRRGALDDQIVAARDFFSRYPTYRHDFLIKPHGDEAQTVKVAEIVGMAAELRAFDIIGFTEKELGRTLLERMENIAKIRDALDAASVRSPIHVFGSLDPVLSPLYFVAGAELFDGLSWLYMAFRDGQAVYREAAAALDGHWTIRYQERQSTMLRTNLTACESLAMDMERYLSAGDFSAFGGNGPTIQKAHEILTAKIGGSGGR